MQSQVNNDLSSDIYVLRASEWSRSGQRPVLDLYFLSHHFICAVIPEKLLRGMDSQVLCLPPLKVRFKDMVKVNWTEIWSLVDITDALSAFSLVQWQEMAELAKRDSIVRWKCYRAPPCWISTISYVTGMVTYSVALAAIAGNQSDSEARWNGYGKANNQVYRRIILHCPWLQ